MVTIGHEWYRIAFRNDTPHNSAPVRDRCSSSWLSTCDFTRSLTRRRDNIDGGSGGGGPLSPAGRTLVVTVRSSRTQRPPIPTFPPHGRPWNMIFRPETSLFPDVVILLRYTKWINDVQDRVLLIVLNRSALKRVCARFTYISYANIKIILFYVYSMYPPTYMCVYVQFLLSTVWRRWPKVNRWLARNWTVLARRT